jgi:hypothetical protein
VGSHPQEVLDLVSAATADLFQGPNVTAIENMFKSIGSILWRLVVQPVEFWEIGTETA